MPGRGRSRTKIKFLSSARRLCYAVTCQSHLPTLEQHHRYTFKCSQHNTAASNSGSCRTKAASQHGESEHSFFSPLASTRPYVTGSQGPV